MSLPDEESKTRFIPATDWSKHHGWPPIGGLRHLIFNAEVNGFSDAFIRCGRRVLVDEGRFFQILRHKNK